MTQDISQLLENFIKNQDKESLVEILRTPPLTVETYNSVCNHLFIYDGIETCLLDECGDYLWDKAQTPDEWMLWGGQKPSVQYGFLDIDAVLTGSDGSGRWFDHFTYRWDETNDFFVDTLNQKGQSNRQIFFETAWHLAIRTNNITVLNKMFGSTPWRTVLCNPAPIAWLYFSLCFERSSPEVVDLLMQSELFPFETILYNQLQSGARNDILEFLLNDHRASPELVAHQYIHHWEPRYYDTDFSKTLNEFIQNSVATQDLDLFHNMVVNKCFIKNRRDLPNRNPERFVEHLKNTPLLEDVKFVCAMLANIDQLGTGTAWPQILEMFVNNFSQSEWDSVVAQYPNNEFLREIPRWQKHILLQQIDLQNNTSVRRKI